MPYKIEVRSTQIDTRAKKMTEQLQALLGKDLVSNTVLIDAYTINKELTSSQLTKVASLLSNPVIEEAIFYSADKISSFPDLEKFDWALERGFLPGVTDNVASTAREAIEDLLKLKFADGEAVYSSQIILVTGQLEQAEINTLTASLVNPLIQRLSYKTAEQYNADGGMDLVIPQVILREQPRVTDVDLEVTDEQLIVIGKKGVPNADGTFRGPLTLDLLAMKTIQAYFKELGRKPTDIELESIAQTWSEHCKHTIFAGPIDEIKEGIFKHFIRKATETIRKQKKVDNCLSVFKDNAGAIRFDENYLVTHKVETHNSPSALDPFGGAITGIVGVNRDTIGFGLGAKPIINTYGFCFAEPNDQEPIYRDAEAKSPMLSPRRIIDGVIAGVNAGGNCSGIPTPQGFAYFDSSYKGKPLVFVGTVGLIPEKINNLPSYEKAAQPGDYIVVAGGRVGLDGIHGATFSSEVLDTSSPATAVQIGDPITQKKMSDALVKEARDMELYTSITDNGAGGISCSVAEMAKESGGFKVELEKVPLKYPGLSPWQIWISESQERMTLSIPPKNWNRFNELMSRRGVEATVIGQFTDSGQCVVTYNGETIMDMAMEFLHEGLPLHELKTQPIERPVAKSAPARVGDLTKTLHALLAAFNQADPSFIVNQYDHEVQSGSVLKPLQGKGRVMAEATVTRPLLSSDRAVALSQALYPTYTDIDPYAMAAASIDTAIRNLVAVGTDPESIALLDNFCWCSSTQPERLWQLKQAAQACYDYALEYQTPYISGKDSMFNDFNGFDANKRPIKISALPTLLISSIGLIEDYHQAVSLDPKYTGDLVYLLGETHEELAGSEYARLRHQEEGSDPTAGQVPRVDATQNLKLYRAYYRAVTDNLVASALSLGRGGLGFGLAKMAMAGRLGLTIDLAQVGGTAKNTDSLLFSESQGRILATVNPKDREAFERALADCSLQLIGSITEKPELQIKASDGATVVNTTVDQLLTSYRATFKDY